MNGFGRSRCLFAGFAVICGLSILTQSWDWDTLGTEFIRSSVLVRGYSGELENSAGNNAFYIHVDPTGPVPTPAWTRTNTPTATPTTPASLLSNPSFELGFGTDGLAVTWTEAKTSGYRGGFRMGFEYATDGNFSQRIDMPQPSGLSNLGVAQRISPVQPGQVYTAECDVRMQMVGETYEGEDLVFVIGIDAFGNPANDFSSAVWSSMVGRKNQWVHVDFSVEAQASAITVFFCGVRKYAQHGDNSIVWVDNTRVSGPPSGPTATPFPTFTATPTSPTNLGPERIVNGSFENGFSGGVGNSWNSFRVSGGQFTQNQLLGRIGGGIYGARNWNDQEGDWNEDIQTLRMSGKTHIIDVSRFDVVSQLHDEFGEDVVTIAKLGPEPYFADQGIDPLQGDIEAHGREFADYCYTKSSQEGHWPHCYYGLNEPNVNELDGMRKASRFEKAFAQRLHERGLRACVLNNSTGTPSPAEHMLLEEVRGLMAVGDYAGYHCYGGPDGFFMCHPDSLESHSLRWRRYAQWYRERGWRFPPVIYTEGTTWWGWVGSHAPEEVRDDLLCFEPLMAEDRWNLGLCCFCTGAFPGQTWIGWDISPYPVIIDAVRNRNRSNPVDAHTGTSAQKIYHEGGGIDAGVNQAVSTVAGRDYWFSGWFKYEFSKGWPHHVFLRVGIDPTGQTSNPDATTIAWRNDLVFENGWESDIWYRYSFPFTATGNAASVWVRVYQAQSTPHVRLFVDDVSVREMLN